MARLIQVIETDELRGEGVPGNPMRRVTQYWSVEGELLAEVDRWHDEHAEGLVNHGRDNRAQWFGKTGLFTSGSAHLDVRATEGGKATTETLSSKP